MQRSLAFFLCLLAISSSPLWGQTTAASEDRVNGLEERIRSLEVEVQSLKAALQMVGTPPATAAPTTGLAQTATAPLPVYGGATAGSKLLNPDIGVIGNFIGATGHNPLVPSPSLSLRESEFGFQAVVDPYARADFFVAIGEEGAEIEEGYLTFPALPGGFLAKIGRMRTSFGKLNPLHSHVLPWADRPLIVYNLLGGEPGEADAGIRDEGVAVSRILPAPAGIFLEGTAEIYQGNAGDLFQAERRSDVSSFYRLRGYRDLAESTNLEVGGSYARGHNELGSDFITHLAGLDAALRWKPLRRAIYHSFIARSEFVWSQREEETDKQRAFGFFASADYQLARRWFAGARFDWSEQARDASLHDSAQSVILTYWPSEFSQIRGQLRRTRYAEDTTANEFLFQFQYNIGAHGAHPF